MRVAPTPGKPATARRRPQAGEREDVVRVLRVRIKDRHAPALDEMARAVNFVWNYCNELSMRVFERERRFIRSAELQRFLAGASKEGLAIGSAVFQQVAEDYCKARSQHRKVKLAWRKSGGARRSLGWIPFKDRSVVYRGGQLHFQGLHLGIWDSWGLGEHELRAGSLSQDARGRWYANLSVRVKPQARQAPTGDAVGIDLGLKELAAFSDGQTVQAERFYRDLEPALAVAQRSGNTRRVRAIHAKIANRRRDHLHKVTSALARTLSVICVGDVNAGALARGKNAKSVLDAGWSAMRTMLRYKCADAGAWFIEVPESGTTRSCSVCGAASGPQGHEGLKVRQWTCPVCATAHHRDVNAARNILVRGLAILEEQFAAAGEARADEAAVNEAGDVRKHAALAGAGHGPPDVGIPVL